MSATSANELVEELDRKHTRAAEVDVLEDDGLEACAFLTCLYKTKEG